MKKVFHKTVILGKEVTFYVDKLKNLSAIGTNDINFIWDAKVKIMPGLNRRQFMDVYIHECGEIIMRLLGAYAEVVTVRKPDLIIVDHDIWTVYCSVLADTLYNFNNVYKKYRSIK